MSNISDGELLEQFVRNNSEAAFSTLVERHLALVHSVALRQTDNPQDAQDISQAVFMILARKAATLHSGTVLPGWLYHTARFTAANFQRAEWRRTRREQEAAMQLDRNEGAHDVVWRELSPHLESAMARLNPIDRDALVLRYFQNRSMAEVGTSLGWTENTAQQRVGRALDKLRKFLGKRGITLTTAAIAAAVSANSVQAAPAGLATAVVMGATAGGPISSLAAAAMKSMSWSTFKTGVAISLAVVAVVMTVELKMQHKPAAVPPFASRNMAKAVLSSPATKIGYSLETLQPPPGFDSLHVNALNNRGQMAGSLDSTNLETHAFVWDGGLITDLGTFGGTKSLASDINDAGDIVGTILTNGERHAFLRHSGVVSDLGLIDTYAKLGLEGKIYYTPRVTINNRGQVAGHLTVRHEPRSFFLNQGQATYFGVLSNASIFYVDAINNKGQMLGRATPTISGGRMRSMLWQDGKIIDLSALEGTESTASALNDHGAVVGCSLRRDRARGFVWENGKLHWLNIGDAVAAYPNAINNAGQIVGCARTKQHGFIACLWTGGHMINLGNLVDMKSGWRLVNAQSINDRGQILARAVNGNQQCYCLLSPPIPPPELPPEPALATAAASNATSAITPFSLVSFEPLPNGAFHFGFNAAAEGKYAVYASTNLVTWTLLGAATNIAGKVEFTDSDAPRFALRFYRLARIP